MIGRFIILAKVQMFLDGDLVAKELQGFLQDIWESKYEYYDNATSKLITKVAKILEDNQWYEIDDTEMVKTLKDILQYG